MLDCAQIGHQRWSDDGHESGAIAQTLSQTQVVFWRQNQPPQENSAQHKNQVTTTIASLCKLLFPRVWS